MKIKQTPTFKRIYKKLHKNQKQPVNQAIKDIVSNPLLGQQKKSDLTSIFVYKFNCINHQYLLAYQWDEKSRTLLLLGTHENFYKKLKNARI